jgi:hypothetical protein
MYQLNFGKSVEMKIVFVVFVFYPKIYDVYCCYCFYALRFIILSRILLSDREDGDGRNIPVMAMDTTGRSHCCCWKNRMFPTWVFNLENSRRLNNRYIGKNLRWDKLVGHFHRECNDNGGLFLHTSRTPSEIIYLSISQVGKIQCDSRTTNRHLSSLICGTLSWCRTFQSTFFTVWGPGTEQE